MLSAQPSMAKLNTYVDSGEFTGQMAVLEEVSKRLQVGWLAGWLDEGLLASTASAQAACSTRCGPRMSAAGYTCRHVCPPLQFNAAACQAAQVSRHPPKRGAALL